MEYIDRTYRKHFRQDRWSYFTIAYKETDLCIGVDRGSWQYRSVQNDLSGNYGRIWTAGSVHTRIMPRL